MYTYDWFMLSDRKQQKYVKQLSFNKKKVSLAHLVARNYLNTSSLFDA